MFQLKYEILLTQVYMIQELIRIYVVFDIACGQFKKNDLQQQKSHTKNGFFKFDFLCHFLLHIHSSF